MNLCITCEPLVTQHIAHARSDGRQTATLKSRRVALGRLQDHLHPLGQHLATATIESLSDWAPTLACGPDGRRGLVNHARAFYRWSANLDKTSPRLLYGLKPPKIPRRSARPIRVDHLETALINAPARLRPWLLLAALGGLRCIEISSLRWENLDLDCDAPTMFVIGKGGHARTVPIGAGLRLALLDHFGGSKRRGWVFPAYTRGSHQADPTRHVSNGQVSRLSCRYLHSTGTVSTMHALRHRFGTDAMSQRLDLALVAQLMGHANIQQTLTYVEVSSQDARAVVDAISANRLAA